MAITIIIKTTIIVIHTVIIIIAVIIIMITTVTAIIIIGIGSEAGVLIPNGRGYRNHNQGNGDRRNQPRSRSIEDRPPRDQEGRRESRPCLLYTSRCV